MLPSGFDELAARYVKDSPRKAALSAARRATSTSADERASADVMYAALDVAFRCRRCGEFLEHKLSRARRIGPSCWEKEPVESRQRIEAEIAASGRSLPSVRGVGRLRSMRRCNSESPMVELVIDTGGSLDAPFAAQADQRQAPFDELFRNGIATGARALYEVDLAYEIVGTPRGLRLMDLHIGARDEVAA